MLPFIPGISGNERYFSLSLPLPFLPLSLFFSLSLSTSTIFSISPFPIDPFFFYSHSISIYQFSVTVILRSVVKSLLCADNIFPNLFALIFDFDHIFTKESRTDANFMNYCLVIYQFLINY